MKKDEKNGLTRKTVRKINIDDVPKPDTSKSADESRKASMGDTKIFRDLPVNDGEEFEFHPDFDTMDFFEDALEPVDTIEKTTEKQNSGPELGDVRRKKKITVPEETDEIPEKTGGRRRVKKLRMTPEELEERKEVRKKRRSQNREILTITYVFAGLFVLMIGYFVYFNAFVSKDAVSYTHLDVYKRQAFLQSASSGKGPGAA